MNTPTPSTTSSEKKIHLSFDVGHSSIGWAALDSSPAILGCGVVTFQNDDCLASERRTFRRQRRQVRATRQRISRIARLLIYHQALTEETIATKHTQGGGHSAPWLLAARVLKGGKLLTWEEMWDVIRWYAHNRGYDGNQAWSTQRSDAEQEDIEKVQNAQALYAEYGTATMAETFCAICNLDPLGEKISCNLSGAQRPKGRNAAFPRADVRSEVSRILNLHCGRLPHLDARLISALMDDWKILPFPEIRLPARYQGGLLFGQLIPRLENRIIATCPITYERRYQAVLSNTDDEAKARHEAQKGSKTPQKDCLEFYRFRWAMQVANIQISCGDRQTRRLTVEERNLLNERMTAKGFLTSGEFKKAVKEITGGAPSNLEQILTHPDADQALILDPARKAIEVKPVWKAIFPILTEAVQKRAIGQLRRGKSVRLTDLLARLGTHPPELEAALEGALNARKTKTRLGQPAVTRESLLAESIQMVAPTGRAPYSRLILNEAADYVFMTDRHPAEEGGPLFSTEAIRNTQRNRAIDQQTNNHLVRHRLLILNRLHADLLREYAGGDSSRVKRVVIEVNRNLRELSGQTAKQIKQELGQQLANFKKVTARLEKAFEGKAIRITPGLIRKARIAEDLGWKCPYTGKSFDEFDLLYGKVDKDHVIPRSERPSDSLDSMVITFSEVNRMKGKRTAYRFIEECKQNQTVEGRPDLTIKTLTHYLADVAALESFKGHDDDKRRKKRRKEFMLLPDYVDKEFTPRDLTQTSQLVRLSAQLLERPYAAEKDKPTILSLSGSLTGAVRKQWRLLGCLAAANPQVLDPETKEALTKTEIREITHLHHALDAAILGLAAMLFPPDNRRALELLVKRRLNAEEQSYIKQQFGTRISFTQEGEARLIDLPSPLKNQLRDRLAERRVVQHIPAELSGLRVEQNAWRVLSIQDGEATLRQRMRQPDGTRSKKPPTKEKVGKLIGLHPEGGKGKLQKNKSVLVIPDNFGLALDPEPRVLPFHKIPVQLQELRKKNGGKPVRVLRNGMVIGVERGTYQGTWKIFSIKNSATGIAMDLGYPDVVRVQDKVIGHKRNVLVATLLKNGLRIRKTSFTGCEDETSS